jgi:hypothetical protein
MNTSARWLSVQSAADILGLTPAALRKSLDRRAVRSPDGAIEAELDGVRGRKLGRLWRVNLGRWQLGLPIDRETSDPSPVAKPDGSGKDPSP